MGIKNGNNKTVSKKQKKKAPLYSKLFLLIAIVLISLISFKVVNKQYNYWLFKQSEVKLQKLALPESDKTEYLKSCSYISTKNLWAGFPNCRVQRVETYTTISLGEATQIVNSYTGALQSSNIEISKNYQNDEELRGVISANYENNAKISLPKFSKSLTCYGYVSYEKNNTGSSKDLANLSIATNCYKKSLFQLYPKS